MSDTCDLNPWVKIYGYPMFLNTFCNGFVTFQGGCDETEPQATCRP